MRGRPRKPRAELKRRYLPFFRGHEDQRGAWTAFWPGTAFGAAPRLRAYRLSVGQRFIAECATGRQA